MKSSGQVNIHRVVNTIFNSCSYVIVNDGCTWVVDCGDVDRILPLVEGRLDGVLLTHAHFDHCYGLNQLLALYHNVPIYTSAVGKDTLMSDKLNLSKYYGEPFVLQFPDNVRVMEDGQHIELFEGVSVTAVATPGHSPCCITWMLDDVLFTGDSLIPGVKTVTNIPHSDKAMARLSETRIRQLSDGREIYPGHAAPSEF